MIASGDAHVFNAHVADFCSAGRNLRLRPISPEDAPRLIAGLELLSDETRFARFFFLKRAFSSSELEHLTQCDGVNHLALVVEWLDEPQRPLVAVGRWIRDPQDATLASIAYLTSDHWQRLGIGVRLVRQLAREALARGIAKFRAEILWGNVAAVKLLERVGVREDEAMIGSGASEYIYRIDRAVLEPGAERFDRQPAR